MAMVMCVCMAFGTVFLTGCGAYAAARQSAQATAQDLKDVDVKLQELYEKLAKVKADYEEATKGGDVDKTKAAALALVEVVKEIAAQEELYKQGKKALDNALKRLEDAKNSEEYVGQIIGIVGGILGSVLGLGGTGFAIKRGKDNEVLGSAVRKTATNVDTFMPEAGWEAFTKAQRDAMTPSERALFDKAANL
jgi:hypothetical protein